MNTQHKHQPWFYRNLRMLPNKQLYCQTKILIIRPVLKEKYCLLQSLECYCLLLNPKYEKTQTKHNGSSKIFFISADLLRLGSSTALSVSIQNSSPIMRDATNLGFTNNNPISPMLIKYRGYMLLLGLQK